MRPSLYFVVLATVLSVTATTATAQTMIRSRTLVHWDPDQTGDEFIHQSLSSSSGGDNLQRTAIVHIGPMKTGSSAIEMTAYKVRKGLEEDGYELAPFMSQYDMDPATVIGCFITESKKHYYSVNFTCVEDALVESERIATVNKHGILMSSEFLSNPDIDISRLKLFLQEWDTAKIVAYYRRFYDWIVSFHNQFYKFSAPEDRKSIVQYVTDLYNGILNPENFYILYSLRKYQEYFSDIHVVHMSKMPNNNGVEALFCEALPHAPKSCEMARESERSGKEEHNHSRDLVYEELAYYAKQMQLWSETTTNGLTLKTVADMAKQRQESQLQRTKYDFDFKKCPEQPVLDFLLQRSLDAERELFPEDYAKDGQAEIRNEFEKYSSTKLCYIDAKAIVENDVGWRDFFQSIGAGNVQSSG